MMAIERHRHWDSVSQTDTKSIIRQGWELDLPAIEQVVRSAYQGYIPRIGKPPAPMADDYRQHIADGNIWVLLLGNQVIGLVVLVPKSDHMLLDNIAVAPQEQGRGFGRGLICFAEDTARQCGYKEIRLYTNELMFENIAFYGNLGYHEVDRRLEAGFKRVYMKKML